MFKNLLFSSFLFISIIGFAYPSKKENTKLLNYCHSLEKILSRNLIQKRRNISGKVMSISKDITVFGVGKSRGKLINEMIDQYKNSRNSLLVNIVPNKIYCLGGYWTETANPGLFESIFLEKSKEAINEFNDLKELKDEVDDLLNEINSEYKSIKDQFDNLF